MSGRVPQPPKLRMTFAAVGENCVKRKMSFSCACKHISLILQKGLYCLDLF